MQPKSENCCWNWKLYKSFKGYGQFGVLNDDRTITHWVAHRYSWTVAYGDIPDGMLVCHHCDNPACCNPKHLFVGTNQDNMDDRNRKNRQAKLKGSMNGFSKLSEESVLEIKRLLKMRASPKDRKLSLPKIAKMYKVSRSAISAISTGQNWSWLEI